MIYTKVENSDASNMKIATNIIAACIFNECVTAYLLLMHSLNIDIDRNCVPYFEYQERERIDSDEIHAGRDARRRISRRYQQFSFHETAIIA